MNMPTISNKPSPTTSRRKRGAQPGNSNALRHAWYSKSLLEAEMPGQSEDGMRELLDELSLAISNTTRLVMLLEKRIRKASPHV